MKKYIPFSIILSVLIILVMWYAYNSIPKAVGSAPAGYVAKIGSSSLARIASQTSTQLYATSTCASRIIGQASSSLRAVFQDNAVFPSGTFGHIHSGSTSVAYDSGIYGCGLWRIYNPSDSEVTFTITEFTDFR